MYHASVHVATIAGVSQATPFVGVACELCRAHRAWKNLQIMLWKLTSAGHWLIYVATTPKLLLKYA